MALSIAMGCEMQGMEAIIRTVADGDTDELAHPIVTIDELKNCHGLALGSPCRFGQMASPMSHFIQQTSTQWLCGDLIDKPACVFTSSASLHGGNESTLLSMALPLLHHGMLLMGVPYSEPALNKTQTGGSPYGATHVSGLQSSTKLSEDENTICKTLGKRLAMMSKQLSV